MTLFYEHNSTQTFPSLCKCEYSFIVPKENLCKIKKPIFKIKNRGPIRHNRKGNWGKY